MTSTFEQEVERGERFKFGENWRQFLELLDEQRIQDAERSLKEMLDLESLDGKTFLDIGSGSGLFSLAARRLGAKVYSFDYDPDSVACTREVKRRYSPEDLDWTINQGSVLDDKYMESLGQFDIVYAWGILPFTGAMNEAIKKAASRVKKAGLFYIALYRKTYLCGFWKIEKKLYSSSPEWIQSTIKFIWILKTRISYFLKQKSFSQMVSEYSKRGRGMDYYRDVHDWLGGYPYESITPDEAESYIQGLGFTLQREKVSSRKVTFSLSNGCDEYVFRLKDAKLKENK
jgi:2-polyprenyl-6-hydroxyphenyl methylase/3-demethylubiquinone-9 3-methyltransferase